VSRDCVTRRPKPNYIHGRLFHLLDDRDSVAITVLYARRLLLKPDDTTFPTWVGTVIESRILANGAVSHSPSSFSFACRIVRPFIDSSLSLDARIHI
jgi:hypothetical protein